MNELKAIRSGEIYNIIEYEDCYRTDDLYYPKSEADKVIAELKDKCDMHDFFWEGCGFAKRGFKNTIAVSEAFDKLEAENAELKAKLESVQATAYTESVDAGMENRKLKRALWLARAERAKETQFLWNVYCHCDKLYFCKPFCVSTRKNPYRYISRMNVVEWNEFLGKIKNKCLAKAEEYK